jgi:hypothetical protein
MHQVRNDAIETLEAARVKVEQYGISNYNAIKDAEKMLSGVRGMLNLAAGARMMESDKTLIANLRQLADACNHLHYSDKEGKRQIQMGIDAVIAKLQS